MNILAVSDILYPVTGGASRSLYEVLKWLSKRHRVHLCCKGENATRDTEDGLRVTYVPRFTSEVATELAMEFLPDVVLTQLEWAPKVIQYLRKSAPVIFFTRDLGFLCCTPTKTATCNKGCLTGIEKDQCLAWRSNDYHRGVIQTRRRLLGQADAIVANSIFMQHMSQKFCNPRRIEVSYPLVDPKKYICKDPTLTKEYVTLVKPTIPKGIQHFYEIAKAMPSYKFMAVGGVVEEVGKQFRELPNATVLNYQKDMRHVYGQTKIILMPSIVEEAFGRAALEGMWNNIPTIGSAKGGIPELIGNAGLVLLTYDVDIWTRSIKQIWSAYSGYTKRAKFRAQQFRPEKQVAIIESLMTSIKRVD